MSTLVFSSAVVAALFAFGCNMPSSSDAAPTAETNENAGTDTAATDAATDGGTEAGGDDSGNDGDGTTAATPDGTTAGADDLPPATTRTLTFTGTVAISNGVSGADLGTLPASGAITSPTVFIVGQPGVTPTFDGANQAFTIALTVPIDQTGQSYEVVTWKTDGGNKFGELTVVTPTMDDTDLGQIDITYTKQERFVLRGDNGTPANAADDVDITDTSCKVEFVGYGDKIPVTFGCASTQKFCADYLPAGDYNVKFTCPSYEVKQVLISVPASTSVNSWDTSLQPITLAHQ